MRAFFLPRARLVQTGMVVRSSTCVRRTRRKTRSRRRSRVSFVKPSTPGIEMAGACIAPPLDRFTHVAQHDYRRLHRRPLVHLACRQSPTGHLCTHEWGETAKWVPELAGEPCPCFRLGALTQRQCSENTQMHMVDTYWPEFGLFDFVPILLEYQRKVWAGSTTVTADSIT